MSDDTKPAGYMSAARLAEIREREAAATKGRWRAGAVDKDRVFVPYEGALEGPNGERVILRMNAHFPFEADAAFIAAAREDVPDLLHHLDALAAGPVPDGDALGRAVADVVEAHDYRPAHDDPGVGPAVLTRSMCEAIGLALYTRGRTAGRAEGEAERARLAEELAGEASRTQRALDRWNADIERHRAEIARLQAELATETTIKEQVQDQLEARRLAYRAEWERAEGLAAELANVRSLFEIECDAHRGTCDKHLAAIAAARVEGARVERRHLLEQLAFFVKVHAETEDERARGAGGAG